MFFCKNELTIGFGTYCRRGEIYVIVLYIAVAFSFI